VAAVRAGRVSPGLEVLVEEGAARLRGRRIGLIANPASVDARLRASLRLLLSCPGISIAALFGPEHGWHGGAQDMIPVEGGRTGAGGKGIRIESLYGDTAESLAPSPRMLEDVDLLVADLQDVGSRYYTFAATIAYALGAIARRGGRLLVLDRPNPLGGARIEGPGIRPGMRSFVGAIDVPIRHGLTMGELLLRHARLSGLEGALEVIPMRGWRREMDFEATGLPWIPPSPNMPTVDTALVYPGSCLVEATNLSEGRGTTRPFEWIGAPWLGAEALAEALEAERLPGVRFRPISFVPAFHKWAGTACGGVAVHVADRSAFRPVRTGIALLAAARRLAPREFRWREEPYEFVADRPAIDLLTGSAGAREIIDGGGDWRSLARSWEPEETAWEAERRDLLLYD
jgi:uncharacterized protein YbbC (DUF1343 family)